MSSLPWFPFYGLDWARSTAGLSPEQKGVYIDLLAHAWTEGGIPADPEACRRIAGADRDEWARIWPALAEKWVAQDGRLVNLRQERERAEAEVLVEKKRRAGKASAESRRLKSGTAQPGAKASTEQVFDQVFKQRTEQRPNQITDHSTHTPSSQSDDGVPRARVRESQPPVPIEAIGVLAVHDLLEQWRQAMPERAVRFSALSRADIRRFQYALQSRNPEEWGVVFRRVAASAYLTGRDGQHPPIGLWKAIDLAARVEAGDYDDRPALRATVREAGLRAGGVVVSHTPRSVEVVDPNVNNSGEPYRFHCAHHPPCTRWAEHRGKDAAAS